MKQIRTFVKVADNTLNVRRVMDEMVEEINDFLKVHKNATLKDGIMVVVYEPTRAFVVHATVEYNVEASDPSREVHVF